MSGLLLNLVGLVAGIAALVWSAAYFVGGSVAFARRCGVSSLLIGMVVIGFGTSLPEMLVSVLAAAEHSPSIALGNAYGSNTANIGLILGLTAALARINVARSVLKREMPILLGVTLFSYVLFFNGVITRLEAAILLVAFLCVLGVNIYNGRRQAEESDDEASAKPITLGKSLFMIGFGLIVLVGSSRLLVVCAIGIARLLGVPDLIIGLTIVAVGTSLPELASSIAAIRKHEHDLVLGNIIGSNLFNTLVVVGLACVITPMTDGADKVAVHAIIVRDYPVVFGLTVALMIVCIPWRRGHQAVINRWEGRFLLLAYLAYLGWLIHDALH
jgi:cation:H+ antiporter